MTNVAADDKMNDVIRSYPVTRCWCFVSHIYLLNWLANWTIAIDLQDDPGHPSATPGHFAMLSHFIVAAYHPDDVVLIAMRHPTNFAVGHRDVVSCSRSHIFSQIFYLPIGVDVFFLGKHLKFSGFLTSIQYYFYVAIRRPSYMNCLQEWIPDSAFYFY